jgi:hypothetical protein
MRKTAIGLVLFLIPTLVMALERNEHSYIPEQGFVPDEVVAVAVAEAIVSRVYGPAQIEHQKPFVASLDAGVWTVSGTLPDRYLGGVFVIKISKKDSRVISLTHGK